MRPEHTLLSCGSKVTQLHNVCQACAVGASLAALGGPGNWLVMWEGRCGKADVTCAGCCSAWWHGWHGAWVDVAAVGLPGTMSKKEIEEAYAIRA